MPAFPIFARGLFISSRAVSVEFRIRVDAFFFGEIALTVDVYMIATDERILHVHELGSGFGLCVLQSILAKLGQQHVTRLGRNCRPAVRTARSLG